MAGSSDDARTDEPVSIWDAKCPTHGPHPGTVDCIDCLYPDSPPVLASMFPTDDARADEMASGAELTAIFKSAFDHACAEWSRENDRLRAELDRHRVAGDAMADELDQSTGISDPDVQRLTHAWRSVRGDAPAVGGDTE